MASKCTCRTTRGRPVHARPHNIAEPLLEPVIGLFSCWQVFIPRQHRAAPDAQRFAGPTVSVDSREPATLAAPTGFSWFITHAFYLFESAHKIFYAFEFVKPVLQFFLRIRSVGLLRSACLSLGQSLHRATATECRITMTRTVLDKHGTKYQIGSLYDAHSIRFDLAFKHQSAGYANVIIDSPHHWTIADLLIYDDSPIPPPRLILHIRSLWNGKPRTRNFRGLGLASVLLQSIIGEAHEYGVRTIFVKLWHKDRMECPFLVRWCAKHGFSEVSREPGHPRNCDVHMELNL